MGLYRVKFENPVSEVEVTARNSTEALFRALRAQSPTVSIEDNGGGCISFNLRGFIDRLIDKEQNRGKTEIFGMD